MRLTLSPYSLPYQPQPIAIERLGDVLTVSGEVFDFTQLPEGATLPAEAVGSDYFVGTVERISGELHLTLRLPHGPNPSHAVAFPQPITVTADGPVELPQ